MKIRKFNTLQEMNQTHQKEISDFPIVFMFGHLSNEEIKERIKPLGVKKIQECVSVGAGGVVAKKDLQRYVAMLIQHSKEQKEFDANSENLYQRILNEMYNHEYGFTQDPEDTLYALGRDYSDLQDPRFRAAWSKAEKECFRAYEEYCAG